MAGIKEASFDVKMQHIRGAVIAEQVVRSRSAIPAWSAELTRFVRADHHRRPSP
ncbi:MAG: hypothetical protein H6747_12625 [Deltaproteobacteria bacterium]|nr:hypothetical protein [Deltaproteobacteria bacterium]